MKVLIIEDDVDSATVLKELLQVNHEVIVAHTANDAVSAGIQNKPNFIISDWDLKDEIDGIEVCRQILEQHKAEIIFLSGSPLDQLKKRSTALSPLSVLSKPIDFDHLLTLLH